MPRYAAKIDKNQPEIVAALRGIGAIVIPMHAVGGGFPDLLVWHNGIHLLEIKDKTGRNYGKDVLTPKQREFHAGWPGEIHIVWSAEDAIAAVR